MAIKFNKTEGSAKKSGVKYMNMVEGENRFRMIGDVLARYVYWLQNGKAKAVFECLAFNRDLEKFTNIEKDWVPELVEAYQGTPRKDTKCAWAYVIQVIDRADGELKVLNLKKKMFESVKSIAEDLGDPTDPETGYDIIVERRKTGPHAYNVEYEVKQIRMMKEKGKQLPAEDIDIINNLKPIDELLPRLTAADQKVAIESFLSSNGGEEGTAPAANSGEAEAISELE
jgi:hypothetical protein